MHRCPPAILISSVDRAASNSDGVFVRTANLEDQDANHRGRWSIDEKTSDSSIFHNDAESLGKK